MRKPHNLLTTGVKHVTVEGSFVPNGSGAIATKFGVGFTVARQSAGVFRVTIDQGFTNFVSIVPGVQVATADTQVRTVRVGDRSVASRYFDIVHLASANTTTTHPVAADISTSGTANVIHFKATIALGDLPGNGV